MYVGSNPLDITFIVHCVGYKPLVIPYIAGEPNLIKLEKLINSILKKISLDAK